MSQRVKTVLDHIGNPDTLIDVGAAGDSISAKDDDWLHAHLANKSNNAIAVDIADFDSVPEWVDYRQQNAESLNLAENADTIVISEVLEHLANPGEALSRIHDHLKPNGKLVLTTPNPYALVRLARAAQGDRPCLSDSHVVLWSKTELQALLEREAFEIQAHSFVPPAGGAGAFLYQARPDLAGPYHIVVAKPMR